MPLAKSTGNSDGDILMAELKKQNEILKVVGSPGEEDRKGIQKGANGHSIPSCQRPK